MTLENVFVPSNLFLWKSQIGLVRYSTYFALDTQKHEIENSRFNEVTHSVDKPKVWTLVRLLDIPRWTSLLFGWFVYVQASVPCLCPNIRNKAPHVAWFGVLAFVSISTGLSTDCSPIQYHRFECMNPRRSRWNNASPTNLYLHGISSFVLRPFCV